MSSVLRSVENFSRQDKKKGKKALILIVYVISVLLYLLIVQFGIRIINVPVQVAQEMFTGYQQEYENLKKTDNIRHQKALVFTSAYGLKIWNTMLFTRGSPPAKDDIVLVQQNSFQTEKKILNIVPVAVSNVVRKILSSMSFGIIGDGNTYTLMRVRAVENEYISFSGEAVQQEDQLAISAFKDKELPFFNTANRIRVEEGTVFLSGNKAYQLDSRYLGTFPLSKIVGKAIYCIGPVWKKIQ